jgi:hypothetical protein
MFMKLLLRTALVAAVAFGVAAPAAHAADRLYFDTTPQLNQSQMNAAARSLRSVGSAYYDVCNHLAEVDKAIDAINVEGRLLWVKRAARVMLRYGHVVQGVDSACSASSKYNAASIVLGSRASSLQPTCYLVPDILPCYWTGALRQRLEKIDRRGWFDYCRITIWSSGLISPPTVVTYALRSGDCR